ncbi:TetR/AcrR family transcriptional regulator [Kordiimonas aquimaris]|uniref:TetR/AcrR family transcriptional regulator n=1 Tax=Kordiimonas aquimaris TaxID=707591 RepID=UPI0021CF7060|nr:TetR family transcriptional regulator [Kordiimonas aquimaris]
MDAQINGKAKRADATRTALIQAAERLIAKKGLADVSTREILQEAGQRNQSALQYHFGSKNGLISATINERTTQIDQKRQAMLAEFGDKPTLRQIFEALIVPLGDLLVDPPAGSNYLNFLSQAITQPNWELRKVIEEFNVIGMMRAYELFDKKLVHMPEKERLMRQYVIFDFTILTLKRWCLEDEPKRSLDEVFEFTIEGSIALAGLK